MYNRNPRMPGPAPSAPDPKPATPLASGMIKYAVLQPLAAKKLAMMYPGHVFTKASSLPKKAVFVYAKGGAAFYLDGYACHVGLKAGKGIWDDVWGTKVKLCVPLNAQAPDDGLNFPLQMAPQLPTPTPNPRVCPPGTTWTRDLGCVAIPKKVQAKPKCPPGWVYSEDIGCFQPGPPTLPGGGFPVPGGGWPVPRSRRGAPVPSRSMNPDMLRGVRGINVGRGGGGRGGWGGGGGRRPGEWGSWRRGGGGWGWPYWGGWGWPTYNYLYQPQLCAVRDPYTGICLVPATYPAYPTIPVTRAYFAA